MTGTKIDGLEVAKNIKNKVSEITSDLKSKGINPCLATILVGDNPASATYVRNKHKACEEVGIITKDHTPSADITQEELNQLIEKLNEDETVHGILVQLPLPPHLNELKLRTMSIKKTKSITSSIASIPGLEKVLGRKARTMGRLMPV